jgi:hypothetical protein
MNALQRNNRRFIVGKYEFSLCCNSYDIELPMGCMWLDYIHACPVDTQ